MYLSAAALMSSRIIWSFYQGKETSVSVQHSRLGLGGSMVMQIVESLPQGKSFKLFMDNNLTSVKLFLELKEMGILTSGTIRANRLLGCTIRMEKETRKEGTGSSDQKVSEDGSIVLVRWQVSGLVNMASAQVGLGNVSTAKSWSEATKKHIGIEYADVISQYNKCMGGVDNLDFAFHFASFAFCNSWLEYLRDANEERLPKKEALDMLAFQTDVANSLITCNKPFQKKRGRPSNQSPQSAIKRAHKAEPLPTHTARYGGYNHWPDHVSNTNAQGCRREGCSSKGRIRCRKCSIFLCLSSQNDCFFFLVK